MSKEDKARLADPQRISIGRGDSDRVWVVRADADHAGRSDMRASLFYEESNPRLLPPVDSLIHVTIDNQLTDPSDSPEPPATTQEEIEESIQRSGEATAAEGSVDVTSRAVKQTKADGWVPQHQ